MNLVYYAYDYYNSYFSLGHGRAVSINPYRYWADIYRQKGYAFCREGYIYEFWGDYHVGRRTGSFKPERYDAILHLRTGRDGLRCRDFTGIQTPSSCFSRSIERAIRKLRFGVTFQHLRKARKARFSLGFSWYTKSISI